MHRHKSSSIPCSSSHVTAIQQRSMDTVPPAYQETRQFPHALPALHTQRQMAGQSAKHHHAGEVWHLSHRSHPTPTPVSIVRSCLPHARQEYRNSCYTANCQVNRHAGGQHKRYKDQLHVNFKSCNLDHMKWETLAEDRSAWREECHNAVNAFEEQRINAAKVRCAARKDRGHSVSSTSTIHTCDMRGRTCSSRIGPVSYTHLTLPTNREV